MQKVEGVKARGLWRVESASALGLTDFHRHIISEIVAAVRRMKGDAAAGRLADEGVEILHTIIDSNEVGALRDFVLERNRNELLQMAVSIGRTALNWTDDFYVDDYLILRINFPYDVARNADPKAENPGIGRVSPQMREIARSRRVVDPVFDPKAYHRGHPPAAWAHGPHQDSWSGHSTDGLNIWWAMCDVPAEASMVLYPELAGKALPPEPRTLYLKAGYQLPAPTFLPLKAGEMLIFDPEILHGTHLNVTSQTRVAVSLRLNSKRPVFDRAVFYAREFWRKASDIESGDVDGVLHLKREENLAPLEEKPPVDWPAKAPTVVGRYTSDFKQAVVNLDPSHDVADRLIVELPDRRVLVQRTGGQLYAVDAACPHYGLDLSDGGAERGKLYCPACGIGFDLATGKSGTPSLSLTKYGAVLADRELTIDMNGTKSQL